jgi:hypothetical protein
MTEDHKRGDIRCSSPAVGRSHFIFLRLYSLHAVRNVAEGVGLRVKGTSEVLPRMVWQRREARRRSSLVEIDL